MTLAPTKESAMTRKQSKAADCCIHVVIDPDTGPSHLTGDRYHVCSMILLPSDTEAKHEQPRPTWRPEDDHPPMAWGFGSIAYRFQHNSDIGDVPYGFHDPEIQAKASDAASTASFWRRVQTRLHRSNLDHGEATTLGSHVRRLATASKSRWIYLTENNETRRVCVDTAAHHLDASVAQWRKELAR